MTSRWKKNNSEASYSKTSKVDRNSTSKVDRKAAGSAEESADTSSDTALMKKTSPVTIFHAPIVCPISRCGHNMSITSVLAHFIGDHAEDIGVQYQEIWGAKRSVLIFDAMDMEFRDTICLGALAYGGIDNNPLTRPAERGVCMHNAFLPSPQEHLIAHMPILILACKTSWSAMLEDKEDEAKVTDPENTNGHLLVIWLAGVQTTKPIHSTITAYSKAKTRSRSTIMQVRNLIDPQNPSDFLADDTNCLMLSRGEVELLSEGGTEFIHLEIVIHEFDQDNA